MAFGPLHRCHARHEEEGGMGELLWIDAAFRAHGRELTGCIPICELSLSRGDGHALEFLTNELIISTKSIKTDETITCQLHSLSYKVVRLHWIGYGQFGI